MLNVFSFNPITAYLDSVLSVPLRPLELCPPEAPGAKCSPRPKVLCPSKVPDAKCPPKTPRFKCPPDAKCPSEVPAFKCPPKAYNRNQWSWFPAHSASDR